VTFAELLTEHTAGWSPPRLDRGDGTTGPGSRVEALAQVHCHQHAVLGWDADARLLDGAGVAVEALESGCCGLAGNFGFTAGHGEVSRALAEQVLLPRLRETPPGTAVLADGFSCRTQIHELDSGGHEAIHLAELLAAGYADEPVDGAGPAGLRPRAPGPGARAATTGLGVLAAATAACAATAGLRQTWRRLADR
jgi:Fe-S oxidoreductase